MSHRTLNDRGPGNWSRKYPTVSTALADSISSLSLDITQPGDAGDTWHLRIMGVDLLYVVVDGDTAADVATGLHAAAQAVTGATTERLGTVLTITRDDPLESFEQPELFGRLYTPGVGESECEVLATERLSGRGETRIRQSVTDPTPSDAPDSPDAVDLGTAIDFAVLAKSAITSAGTEVVTGDMGISPAAAAAITGFALSVDGGGQFATSAEVTGSVYASDYAVPTPAMLTQAVSDMEAAYTAAAGVAPDSTELAAGLIGGLTLVPGVYKWTTGVTIASDLTLAGGASDVWIFQISGVLDLAAATDVLLSGGAVPENVFWQVAGGATLGATATMRGVILSATTVTMGVGTVLEGRALAQTAVTMDSSTITEPV
jgi:hypothetical protein